ncbi:uncharacterized protein LOC111480786 [Cucurbita maxima]|uniref:Uncharacterized protein LOC111480786 n=1 Tax=Cucurbita maxima TaxID=3661 RepID=A0A6J1IXC1_CUCMA|nr:uncharacterized protein LOC111480786 [Cucurbita maxima]
MNSTDQLCNFEATKIPQPQPQPQPQPHGERKKQVRRRRETRRLYKQMPLNMAEARREIVTALKLHRASTKEAKEQQQKQDQQIKHSLPVYPHQFTPCFEPERRMKSRRNPRIYPDCSFYFQNGSDFIAPPPVAQSLHLDIPIQTLGLNPNFEDTSSVVCNNNNNHSFYSLSFLHPSSYICPTFDYAATTHREVPKSISLSEEEGRLMASDLFWSNNFPTGESEKEIHGAVEEEEEEEEAMVAEIRSMDEKPLEIDGQTHCTFENVPTGQSEEAMEFPDWLSINDDFLQPRSNYQFSNEDYLQDPDLSCMDIGEIEDVDGDWLA